MKLRVAGHTRGNRRGTALILAIVVSVVITGMVITLAWSGGVQAEMAGNLMKMDQAFYTAESGAQRVAWYAKHGKMGTISVPLTGLVGSYGYSASWTTVVGGTIRVGSTGSLGSVSYTCYQTVAPPTIMPAVATSGDFDNKNIAITGDIVTGGTYSNSGSGSLSGNIYYATPFANSAYQINMTTMDTTLSSAAGREYSSSQSNTVFDFTMVSGTNKVIKVDGDVNNPTFIGSGTLYATGNVTVDGFGTSGTPVNVVADGNVTSSNNITVYGTVYTGGTWTHGKINWTGLIYAAGGMDRFNNGHSTLVETSAPWFDPRSFGTSGTSLTGLSSFAGPLP